MNVWALSLYRNFRLFVCGNVSTLGELLSTMNFRFSIAVSHSLWRYSGVLQYSFANTTTCYIVCWFNWAIPLKTMQNIGSWVSDTISKIQNAFKNWIQNSKSIPTNTKRFTVFKTVFLTLLSMFLDHVSAFFYLPDLATAKKVQRLLLIFAIFGLLCSNAYPGWNCLNFLHAFVG